MSHKVYLSCKLNLAALLLSTILSFNCSAEELPLNFAMTYDTSQIRVNNEASQASRMLATLAYEQNFNVFGGQLSPQLSYSIFRGRNGSDVAQDVLGFSNIDADQFSAWQEISINWQNDSTFIRLGQLDANANFASIERAGQFINSSFGLTPTALPLPTYPDMEYGLYVQHQVTKNMGVSVGYYRPDEVDYTGEQQPLWVTSLCWLCSDELTVNFGYWNVKHKQFKSINGAFTYIEGNINKQLNGFALFSINDRPVSEQTKRHLKMGLTYDAPFGFDEQQIGVGYSRVYGPDDETVVELFYLIPITKFASLQPDLQWVQNNIDNHVDNIIATLRVIIEW